MVRACLGKSAPESHDAFSLLGRSDAGVARRQNYEPGVMQIQASDFFGGNQPIVFRCWNFSMLPSVQGLLCSSQR